MWEGGRRSKRVRERLRKGGRERGYVGRKVKGTEKREGIRER